LCTLLSVSGQDPKAFRGLKQHPEISAGIGAHFSLLHKHVGRGILPLKICTLAKKAERKGMGWKDEGSWDWNMACIWLCYDISCEVMEAVKENTRIFTSWLVASGHSGNLKYCFLGERIISYSASPVRNQERRNIGMMFAAPWCGREYYHS